MTVRAAKASPAAKTAAAKAGPGRESHVFTLSTGVQVELWKPTEMQVKVMARVAAVQTIDGLDTRSIILVDQMFSSLFVDPAEWTRYEDAQVCGQITPEQYTGDLLQVFEHFFPQSRAVRRQGPAAKQARAVRRR